MRFFSLPENSLQPHKYFQLNSSRFNLNLVIFAQNSLTLPIYQRLDWVKLKELDEEKQSWKIVHVLLSKIKIVYLIIKYHDVKFFFSIVVRKKQHNLGNKNTLKCVEDFDWSC